MEYFTSYLLKSAAWLTGFSLIYLIFLRNERYFRIKRLYLIAGIIASFIFPLISFRYNVEMPEPQITLLEMMSSEKIPAKDIVPPNTLNYRYLLLFLYVGGMIFLSIRTIRQMRELSGIIKKTGISNRGSAKIVRAEGISSSFSFFNYVFISPAVKESDAIQMLDHEEVHVSQKHWFDLLLAEVLRTIQWANPFAWLYTGFIKQNHEFLADAAVLERTTDPAGYRATLMNQIFNAPVISLSNSFTCSISKKRFDMMKKIMISPYRKLKLLLVLPVIAILFYAFATPEYKYVPVSDSGLSVNGIPTTVVKDTKGIVLKADGTPFGGVNILVAGTSTRTTTDASGNFSLTGIPEDASLVFSFRGYITQFLKADFKSAMSVTLLKDPDYKEPEIAFQTRDQDASVISSKLQESEKELADALYVVDGTTTDKESFKKINVQYIQTLSILKGVSATKVFGDKGKNGVIVVTTKRGESLKQPGTEVTQTSMYIPPQTTQNVTQTEKYIPPQSTQPQQPRSEPLVVVDEVISTKSRSEAMAEIRDEIGTMRILSPEDAAKKYGDKGKYGVIEILTISKAKELGIKIPFRRRNPEDFPTFQGKNYGSFSEWIASQTKYPPESTAKGNQGFASVDFTVEADGSVTNVKASSVPDPFIGEALVKVVQSSPKWEPAKNPEAREPFTTNATVGFELPDRVTTENVPFVVVEQMPVYPGGQVELLKFIAENTQYPDSAKAKNIQGRVIVRFAISKEGKVGNISVLKGVDPLLDAEAIRVTKTLPDFTPGYQGGKPVSVWYMIPITFTLK